MAIKDSDAVDPSLSFENDIVPEFLASDSTAAGNRPHSLSEYYKEGGIVPAASPANDRIPLSGSISFHDFYGAVNQITVELTSSDITSGSVNLYSLAQSLGGATPVNNEITTPFVFVFPSSVIVYATIYTGGYFSNLKILVESGALVYGAGGSPGNNGQPAINVNSSMGSLEVINEGWIASGGNGGTTTSNSAFTGAPTSGDQANILVTATGGGGGGEGGVRGGGSAVRTQFGDNNFYHISDFGSGNQIGGNGSNGQSLNGSGGTHDRIGIGQHCSGSGCEGTVSGGTGGSGGGRGGAATAAAQSNADALDGYEYKQVAGGGGGSSRRGQSTGLAGTNGSSTNYTIDGSGDKNFKTARAKANGTGGQGFGSATTISGTSNASSYTYTNNGGTLL